MWQRGGSRRTPGLVYLTRRVHIGVFGGTFDPPHVGHLLAASDAMEKLGLDRVLFIPARQSPFKAASPPTDGAHRLAMLRLMVGDDPRFEVDPIELERAGLSYTVDTLIELHHRWSGASFTLLMGEDSVAGLGGWRDLPRLLSLARIGVLGRGGSGADRGEGADVALPAGASGALLQTRRIEVSASEIRARVARGLPIRGFVPESVAAHVAEHGLYR